MYQKTLKLGGRITKVIRTFGIESNQGDIDNDKSRDLRIWETCIKELYDLENRIEDIVIEANTSIYYKRRR